MCTPHSNAYELQNKNRCIVCYFSFAVGNNYFLEELENKRQPNFTTKYLEMLAPKLLLS